MNRFIRISRLAALLLLCVLLASCGGEGPEVRTLYPGDGLREPETIIITLPAETVIVTVPVIITDVPPVTEAPDTTPVQTAAPVTEPPATEPPAAPAYEIAVEERSLGTESRALLRYPVLRNDASSAAIGKVNELMADFAFKDFSLSERCKDYSEKIASGSRVTYTVTSCDVTLCTSAYLSVRTEGEYEVSGEGAPRRLIFTHLYNLSTGKEIKTKNVFTDAGAVLKLIGTDRMPRVSATPGFDEQADVAAMLRQYQESMLYGVLPRVYFSDNALTVILELEQDAGGHAEYRASLDTVSPYLAILP